MEVYLAYTSNEPVEFSSGCPDDFSGRILAGSDIYSATDHVISLVVQEFLSDQYTVRYNIFRFFQKMTLRGFCRKPGLYIRIMLKGRLTHRIKDLGRIHLKEGRFAILMIDSVQCLTQFEKGKEYETFDLYFSGKLLESLATVFPKISRIMEGKARPVIQLTSAQVMMDPPIMTIIDQLLSAPFNKPTGRIFIEEKIEELLHLLLAKVFSPLEFSFSVKEREALNAAKELIEKNYSKHFTIRRIARHVGLNELKLKKGFRQVFNMGIFDCLIHARMKKGLELVLTSDLSIKEISYLVGYRRLTSFVTAFRKYYGKSPGKMRFKR